MLSIVNSALSFSPFRLSATISQTNSPKRKEKEMKLRERIDSVKAIPERVSAAVNTTIVALVVAICAFVMAAMTLVGGVRHAN
jgi:hypothetical protein